MKDLDKVKMAGYLIDFRSDEQNKSWKKEKKFCDLFLCYNRCENIFWDFLFRDLLLFCKKII